jgi:uncharacterized protein YgbK (DUF1537 family)
MDKLLVIADDFTGALDTGVQFSKKGISALVLTAGQLTFDGIGEETDVLIVDTESRHLPSREAHDIVAQVTSNAWKYGFRHFYKKTDSALRGNIGAELAGFLEGGGGSCLTFVPAFPKSHRVTRNGIQYIDGVEAARSVFSKDPFTPVTHSSVTDIIHLQADILTENIASDAYEKAEIRPEEKTLRILDAESMDDIRALGNHLKRSGNLDFLAGCAGFAEILPDLLELPTRSLAQRKREDNLLVVSGSVNPITIEQLTQGGNLGFSIFTLSFDQKLDVSYPQSRACDDFVQDVTKELRQNSRVIIRAVEQVAEFEASIRNAHARGIAEDDLSRRVADNIGEITLRILDSVRVGILVIFGGDTLHSVLLKMHCDGVIPLAELSPGVVAAKILSGRHEGVIVTKSGGLGCKDVLRQIEEFVFEREDDQ